ncbi:MAG: hypothetical protein C0511_14430 [Hyphomicrobium sp.]|nr:hypothetical protein [Hyphomicrobium sp.]
MRKLLLASLLLGSLYASPVHAQLVGTDTVPGSSCAGFPDGATRMTADADLNGADVVLVCDGTNWLIAPGAAGAAGTTSQVQYNSGGALAGHSGFTYDGAGRLMVTTSAATAAVDGTTSYSGVSGGIGVSGTHTGAVGGYGVWGQSSSSTGTGVYGRASAVSGENYGVYGTATSPTGFGVYSASRLGAAGAVQLLGDLTTGLIAANQNDYNPPNLVNASVLRLSANAAYNITGLQGGADGRILTLTNVGANAITLVDESASSTAANRFALAGNITLAQDQSAVLLYDTTSSRWRGMSVYGPGGAASAGGSDRQIQFNSGGALTGLSNFDLQANGSFDYWQNLTTTTGGTYTHTRFHADIAPTAAQTAGRVTRGLEGAVWVSAGNTNQVRKAVGFKAQAQNTGTGPIEDLMASDSYVFNSGNATITDAFGSYVGAETTTGTVSNLYGQNIDTYAGGGTVTNNYGLAISMFNTGSTITNRFGVYLETPSGAATNDWGIYQNGTQNNRLGGGLLLAGDISPASIGANQNDYAPTGHATASVLRLAASAAYDITGLAGGADGRIVTLINIGANTITLRNESASSVAGNRYAGGGTDAALAASDTITLIYDSTSSRWRPIAFYNAGAPFSDIRLKRDVQPLEESSGLDAIMKINPIRFHWKDDAKDKSEGPQIGLSAQDVQAVLPHATYQATEQIVVKNAAGEEKVDAPLAVDYEALIVPLIKAVQDLKAENDILRQRVEALEGEGQ